MDEVNEELLGLILDFQELLPVGSEVIQPGRDTEPANRTADPETLEAELLARAVIWADRDAYNDYRGEMLDKMLAQVKVTLGTTGTNRLEALKEARETLADEVHKALVAMLSVQDQGPVD